MLSLVSCKQEEGQPRAPRDKQEDSSGGVGMTYGGKLGIDIGGGFVIPFDGSSPGFGFEF